MDLKLLEDIIDSTLIDVIKNDDLKDQLIFQ